MSKTLAELRAQKTPSLPTRILKVCLDLEVLGSIQRLIEEKQDAEIEWQAKQSTDDDAPKKPKRSGEGKPPRIAEIDAELETCWEKMRAAEGELLLRGIPGGEWLRWKDEHPAREGNQTDDIFAFGMCNATDLVNDLARYVVKWDGEDLAADDWEGWLKERIAAADVSAAARSVVELMETRVTAPKAQSVSSVTPEPASA